MNLVFLSLLSLLFLSTSSTIVRFDESTKYPKTDGVLKRYIRKTTESILKLPREREIQLYGDRWEDSHEINSPSPGRNDTLPLRVVRQASIDEDAERRRINRMRLKSTKLELDLTTHKSDTREYRRGRV
jgi:hypothetical protein